VSLEIDGTLFTLVIAVVVEGGVVVVGVVGVDVD
jgi:hypothetical protein